MFAVIAFWLPSILSYLGYILYGISLSFRGLHLYLFREVHDVCWGLLIFCVVVYGYMNYGIFLSFGLKTSAVEVAAHMPEPLLGDLEAGVRFPARIVDIDGNHSPGVNIALSETLAKT